MQLSSRRFSEKSGRKVLLGNRFCDSDHSKTIGREEESWLTRVDECIIAFDGFFAGRPFAFVTLPRGYRLSRLHLFAGVDYGRARASGCADRRARGTYYRVVAEEPSSKAQAAGQ